MKGLTMRTLAEACGGILFTGENPAEADREIESITTDSRRAEPGCVFAAIPGERTDGHLYIPQVCEKGAAGVIAEREVPGVRGCWIRVNNTIRALGDIAQFYRQNLGIPAVGVTGSVGKTSTKETLAAVLNQKYRTLKTAGNFNNDLGLPLTIFRLQPEDEMAVLEMGINHFGEMHRLAQIARPDICVITNIGECHLEYLGNRDGVLAAKSEIFDYLNGKGHIVLNGCDDKLVQIREANGVKPVFFGIAGEEAPGCPGLDVWADQLQPLGLKGIACRIHAKSGSFEVTVPIPGKHMVMNALAAAAVGVICGLSSDQIKAGIESLQSVGGRFNLIEANGLTIVDDCYNANPMSMTASLGIMKDADGVKRKVAILGDMGELGSDEIAMHEKVGAVAAGSGLDLLITVGRLSTHLAAACRDKAPEVANLHFDTLEELFEQIDQLIVPGDAVLVKASHSMQFDRIVNRLKE
ncbi:MAG: UDP-N-acetylmuramoyl-tripeptide--D-alanyl-D-alanine ligase [Lachnospiraceae bacterium]|nr:UDP-N-acetylmuramoyl-tripeptide--D-alanyl-D-alanine ligase [Lachnospiraceae bacterium]